MQNLKRALLLLMFLSITGRLLAQETVSKGDIIIHIRTDDNWGYTFFDDIYQHNGKATIMYSRPKTVRREELYRDTAYLSLLENSRKYATSKVIKEFKALEERYTTYNTDIVVVNLETDTAYKRVIAWMAKTNKADLEKRHEEKQPEYDSSDVTFTITTNNTIKNVYIHELTNEGYPELADFLRNTYNKMQTFK